MQVSYTQSMTDHTPPFSLNELEKMSSKADYLQSQLARLENVMARINDGTYGKCAVCKQPIESELLQSSLDVVYCNQHAESNRLGPDWS